MRKHRKLMQFRVILEPPAGATVAELRAYIEDAVATWKGSYHPEEPVFDLDGDTVRVVAIVRSSSDGKDEHEGGNRVSP